MSLLNPPYYGLKYQLSNTYDDIYQLISSNPSNIPSQEVNQDKLNYGIRELQNILKQIEYIDELENDATKPNFRIQNVTRISKSIFEGFRSLASERGIDWIFDSTCQESKKEVSEDILLRILSNLLSYLLVNYYKGDTVRMNINSRPDGATEIKLSCQIRHEVIFDDNSAVRLVFVHKMIRVLGGSFFIEAKNQANTSYRLILNKKNTINNLSSFKRINKNNHVATPEPALYSKKDTINLNNNKNILIIEDIEGASYNLRGYLEKGNHIFHSDNTIAGVKRGIRCNPSVIIYDNVRSVQRGVNILRYLKSNLQTATTPIAIIYLETPSIIGIEELLDHSDVQLHKPYTTQKFQVIIKRLLEVNLKKSTYLKVKDNFFRETPYSTEDDLFLQRVYLIVNDNIGNTSFDIPKLCILANTSKSQMHRKLKATIGFSALKIIRTVRLNKAQQLLKSTSISISQVAFEIGFSDSAYFAKIFSKELGQTPTQFRRRYR